MPRITPSKLTTDELEQAVLALSQRVTTLENALAVQSVTVSNANVTGGGITAFRVGNILVVQVFAALPTYSGWADNQKIADLSVGGYGAYHGALYSQDAGRCLQLFASAKALYVRNKNSAATGGWCIGEVVTYVSD